MKETETQVKSVNVESENIIEKVESVDSWNQERSEDDLDSFLEERLRLFERRLGESGLNLFELAA